MLRPPIAISLSPNTQKEDVWLALKTICQPQTWQKGEAVDKVEEWFKEYFQTKDAVSFNSGRSALYALLKVFGVGKDDEVLLQAFTCVAVPDSIIWVGAKPIFIDIDETFNIDPEAIEKYINPKTRVIIVQHTFGIPAQIEKIKKITQKHRLILIEDCAHALGATYKTKKLGSFGDAAFFSFGRDKIISSVFGGMAIINQKSEGKNLPAQAGQKLRDFQKQLPYPNNFWIGQQLLHPVAFSLILPLYNFLALGKVILKLMQNLHLLSFPVYSEEKEGKRPNVFPTRLPNALAVLALNQLKKLNEFNQIRIEFGKFYFNQLKDLPIKLPDRQNHSFLRYPILTKRANALRQFARTRRIILGDWYSNIIDPKGVDLIKVGYCQGNYPKAQEAAIKIVNLPTYPRMTLKDAEKIVKLIYEFFKSK